MSKPKSAASAAGRTGAAKNTIAAARTARRNYIKLSQELCDTLVGYRDRLYRFAMNCYTIGRAFADDLPSYHRFMSDEFWNDVRQKPTDDETIKAVLIFAMDAKSKQLRNRVVKTAAVLNLLAAEELEPRYVPARLKAEGGIEVMYCKVTGKSRREVLDDINMLAPVAPEDDEDEPSQADVEATEKSEEESDEGSGDSPPSAKDASEGDHRSEQAPSRAASDRITTADFGGQVTPPTAPPLGERFDRKRDLAVRLGPPRLARTLRVEQRILIEAIVGPKERDGWRLVRAEKVSFADLSAGPWSKPEIDREDS